MDATAILSIISELYNQVRDLQDNNKALTQQNEQLKEQLQKAQSQQE